MGRRSPKRVTDGLLEQLRNQVQGQAGQAADQRPVDADELEVSPDRELHATRGMVRVPGGHRQRDEFADVILVALDHEDRDVDDRLVQPFDQLRIALHVRREGGDAPLHRASLA